MAQWSQFFSPLPSPVFQFQAAELAPALQTDMEVKEAIQGAIQGENGEVVQIVTSVATWGAHHLIQNSREWSDNSQWNNRGRPVHTDGQAILSERIFKKYWRSLIKQGKEAVFFFVFFPFSLKLLNLLVTRCCKVEMFTNNLKRLLCSQNPLWSFRWFSSPEGRNPQQNTQWDYCVSRDGAVYADHHPITSSAHTLVYINFGKPWSYLELICLANPKTPMRVC